MSDRKTIEQAFDVYVDTITKAGGDVTDCCMESYEAGWQAAQQGVPETAIRLMNLLGQKLDECFGYGDGDIEALLDEWREFNSGTVLSATPQPEGDGWLSEVAAERCRQDQKWGGPEHDDKKSPNDFVQHIEDYAGWARVMAGMGSFEKYRRRMVQVAALAGAAIEAVDRAVARPQPPQEGDQ